MAIVAKIYGVGDTVWVAYPFPNTLSFVPQSRVVKEVQVLDSVNEAVIFFESGEKVMDGLGAGQTVYTTQVTCAKKIVDDVIVNVDPAVNLDTTLSLGSTVAQPALSLGRVDA